MLNKHLKIVATILAILSFPPSMNADGDKQTPVPTHRRIPPQTGREHETTQGTWTSDTPGTNIL